MSGNTYRIPGICIIILLLTSAFTLTVSLAQTKIDQQQAAVWNGNSPQVVTANTPELIHDTQIINSHAQVQDIPVRQVIVPMIPADNSDSLSTPAEQTKMENRPAGETLHPASSRQEVYRIVTEVYDRSLGSLKLTLAIMIGVIGLGMVVAMLVLGYLDLRRRRHHEYILFNSQKLSQQIQVTCQELRSIYLQAKEWEKDVSQKLRERYEIHTRKNQELMQEVEAARQKLSLMEQEFGGLSTGLQEACQPFAAAVLTPETSSLPINFTTRSSPKNQPESIRQPQPVVNSAVGSMAGGGVMGSLPADVSSRKQEILNRVHQTFERELQKNPHNPAVYLNWGNACLKLANKLKGQEREQLLESAREKWMLAERYHAGTARMQLSVLKTLSGMSREAEKWAAINQEATINQGAAINQEMPVEHSI